MSTVAQYVTYPQNILDHVGKSEGDLSLYAGWCKYVVTPRKQGYITYFPSRLNDVGVLKLNSKYLEHLFS